MNVELAADYHAENIVEDDLRRWIEVVRLLDEKCLRYLARQKEAVENALRTERAHSNVNKKTGSSVSNNRSAGKSMGSSKSTGTAKPFVRLPSLTDNECVLLRENDGCFKCREPFAGHTLSSCSKGFPDGASYKTLTATAVAAKKNKKNVVAAVDIEEESDTVAVVMPSAVLGDGTDSDDECVAPLQTPHLRWDCLVDGPNVSSPVKVSALIDHGSSLVLIGEDLAKNLGLCCHQLTKPLPVSLAFAKDKKQFLLSEYVKLSCTSMDLRYRSRTVQAIVAPNLCTPDRKSVV